MSKDQVHDKETHGTSDDIDETTPIDKVKAPDVFQRAKEEIEALVDAFRTKKEPESDQIAKKDGPELKLPNLEQIVNIVTESLDHQKEEDKSGYETSKDINENTPIDKVKAPDLLERAKEEIQAVVHSIHGKKEVTNQSEETKPASFLEFLGGILEKFCAPSNVKKD